MPKNVFFTGQVPTAADFNSLAQDANMLATGGTIDGTVIGGTTPAAATATALTSTTSTTLASEAVVLTANNLPVVRPTLQLDFANSKTVDPRITFTRASIATRINENGLIEPVDSSTPRIDYDQVTLACVGLLIEESRTNLVTYSAEFDNAAWTKLNTTITANAAVSPDGTTTADTLVEAAGASFKSVGPVLVFSAVTYTYSCFVKAAGRTVVQLLWSGGASTDYADFDLSTGTVTAGTYTSAAITAYPNSWYRITITSTVNAGSYGPIISLQTSTTATRADSYTGDGTSGIYIWGAQLEAGAFPTSYTPTVASQVTRATDVALMTGTNFSSWYKQDEGTFVARCAFSVTLPTANFGTVLQAQTAGSGNNRLGIAWNPADVAGQYVESSGVSQVNSLVSITPRTVNKFAVAFKLNDFAQSLNSGAVVTDGAGLMPVSIDSLFIGSNSTAVKGVLHIAQISYYPTRLSNTQLQALSTP